MVKKQAQDRIAVITGAGGTLCSEMARCLAKQGIKVALLGRTLNKLKAVEEQINQLGGVAKSYAVDVTSEEDIRSIGLEIQSMWGGINILINGAGGNEVNAITTVDEFEPMELEGNPGDLKGFFNLDMSAFDRVLEINTMGTVIPCKIFGHIMAQGGGGSIINIASMNSYRPLSRVGAYAMAKAGIENFTKWLAAYLAPAGIRVNGIAPGFFLNEKSKKRLTNEDGTLKERGTRIMSHTPMKKFGESEQLTGCLTWLIDDEASGFVTGVTVPVDGGFLSSSGV